MGQHSPSSTTLPKWTHDFASVSASCSPISDIRHPCLSVYDLHSCYPITHPSTRRKPPQASEIAVEDIGISRVSPMVSVLPESVIAPSCREGTDSRGITSDPKWAGRPKASVITRAGLPPVSSGVDYWVAASFGLVGVGEVPDPGDHCRLGQAIASGAIGIVLNVQCTWKGSPITAPTPPIDSKIGGLSSTTTSVW